MARSYHMGIPEHNGQILSITARSHFPADGAFPGERRVGSLFNEELHLANPLFLTACR